MANNATTKQKDFIRSLLADREGNPQAEALRDGINHLVEVGNLTVSTASSMIDLLKKVPSNQRAALAITEDGIYVHGDTVYKVYLTRESKQLVCKRLEVTQGATGVEAEWIYEGKRPLRSLTPEDKLSQEKAAEFGKLYGICINCLADLTDERSISVGYGPVCARRHGWFYPTAKEAVAMMDAETRHYVMEDGWVGRNDHIRGNTLPQMLRDMHRSDCE